VSYTPPEIPEDARKIAKKFFERANTVADTRNYDYAIELFIQGLTKDPQAVEEGHKPLREIGIKRLATGGKKAGFLETLKRGTSNKKDPVQAMLNAEYFLSKDPLNVTYIEALVKSADQAELPETLFWALRVFLELARREKKPNLNRLLTVKEYSEKLGNHFDQVNENDKAIQSYENGVDALEIGLQTEAGRNMDFMGLQRNLAGRLTILRGKYEKADSFRDSIQDADKQKYLHDKGRKLMGDEQQTDVIEQARKEVAENPNVTGKINTLVDLLLQRGKPEDETEAISILESRFAESNEYNYKKRADDVRIRQLSRAVSTLKRQLEEKDDPNLRARYQQTEAEFEDFELKVFKNRIDAYPTDSKLKYEYGRRLYRAKRYDEAIPFLQESVADPKYSVRARHFIGACFFQKEWYPQAIDILTQAIASHETPNDTTGKDMYYMLGRSYENAGQKDEAMKVYNKMIQLDFNYRDVRQRIDSLRQ
jgi:tetratricopeptide (TPR) repeat protein